MEVLTDLVQMMTLSLVFVALAFVTELVDMPDQLFRLVVETCGMQMLGGLR